MKRLTAVLLLVATAAMGAGCDRQTPAPSDTGVCWHALPQKGGSIKFNKLATNIDSVEKCASELEGMRLRFVRLGGADEIMGAYQGSYLFLQHEGIFRSETLNGNRYIMLVRTGDGRLAIPGAMPQQP